MAEKKPFVTKEQIEEIVKTYPDKTAFPWQPSSEGVKND